MTRIIILAALIISFIIGFADGITGFMMVAALGSGFTVFAIMPPVLAVPLLLVEFSLTGSFAWEFNRTYTSTLRTHLPEARRRRVPAYSVS